MMEEMWAATWIEWNLKYFYSVEMYRRFVHDALLEAWFPAEEYESKKGRELCLRRLRRKGIRVVKVGVSAI